MKLWACPSCDSQAQTVDAKIPMHPCRGLKGLVAPLVPLGAKAKHEVVEREDLVGSEVVQTDGDGRPIMSVITTRDDGQDCTVYSPTAQADYGEE